MKYARIEVAGQVQWALYEHNCFRTLSGSPFEGGQPGGVAYTHDEVRLVAPVAPSKIFCVGRNYAAHRTEMGYAHDGAPSIFMKGPSTIIGPGENIVLPPADMSGHVEHEAELAFVVGRTARFVAAADAADHIFGYTCANDVSARDLQRADPQLTRGKGFDTFCPVGPWIETDLDAHGGVRLTCTVNGTVRQDASTAEMTYDIAFLVEYLSAFATLHPGDLVLTGSPGGTAQIHPGDAVEIEVAGIGTLRNAVTAGSRPE